MYYMSYIQLESMIKKEGYKNVKCMWYLNPCFSFAKGLKQIKYDNDVLKFIEEINGV